MSLALYRRYRPETFEEVIGQEHVTRPLQQALRNGRVNHAYLFSGPRGCGKTTSARILARALNCEKGPTDEPCGQCRSCVELARNGPGSIDVIEIDAASHGGVDDARDLRERAVFSPAASRYKVYIIDEAHMVTSAGFNALLKVVEEPPEHLKFIFATTEPEKVIGTIRSRTHHYPFRLVPPGVLREYLAEMCQRERIEVDRGVLPLVVRAGGGSVRDSLSVLDQLLAGAGDDGVTYAMAVALLGYTDATLLDDMLGALAAHDSAAVFGVINGVVEGGHDPRRFVADLLERFRDLIVLDAVPGEAARGLIEGPEDQLERMRQQAAAFGPAELSRAAEVVNAGLTAMRGTTTPRLQLELIAARLLLPGVDDTESGFGARLDRLERRLTLSPTLEPRSAAGSQPLDDGGTVGASNGGQSAPRRDQAAPACRPPDEPVEAPPEPTGADQPGPRAAGEGRPPRAATPGAATSGRSGFGTPPWKQQQAPREQPEAARQPVREQEPAGRETRAPAAAQVDAVSVRRMWPEILEAVKGLRRFTWILLSQNAEIVAVDATTLQLGFVNAGARDSFANSSSDAVLRQALAGLLGVDWKIEAIVSPGRGGGVTPPPEESPAPPPARSPAPTQAPPRPEPERAVPTEQRPVATPPAPVPVDEPPPPPSDEDEESIDSGDSVTSQELLEHELGARFVEEIDNGE